MATFKICIFGNGGVGKTTLVQRFVTNRFLDHTIMTIGVDLATKHLKIGDWTILLQIWDFGGEERFRFFLPAYARGASGGIFMYDLTRFNSLFNFREWMDVFFGGAKEENESIPIIMVGGKLDLEDRRVISPQEVINYVKDYNISNIIECSSKTGENVEKIFKEITVSIMKQRGYL